MSQAELVSSSAWPSAQQGTLLRSVLAVHEAERTTGGTLRMALKIIEAHVSDDLAQETREILTDLSEGLRH